MGNEGKTHHPITVGVVCAPRPGNVLRKGCAVQEPHDLFGKNVRFACGALVGAVVGTGVVMLMNIGDWPIIAAVAGAAALVCGLLAMRWG